MKMVRPDLLQKCKKTYYENYYLNGGARMYNYSIDNTVTDKVLSINNSEKKRKKVEDLLSAIDNVEKLTQPVSANAGSEIALSRKQTPVKTTEEIEKEAQNSLATYKSEQEKSIADENKEKESKLIADKETLLKSGEQEKNTLEGYYANAKQNVSDEALKRGLARSSIVINQLGAFDQDQISRYAKIDEQINDKINSLEFELSGLQGELTSALNDFNVSYATKLQEKISQLNGQLEAQVNSALEYNNEIALQEAKFNQGIADLQKEMDDATFEQGVDLLELQAKYGANVVNKFLQDNVYKETKKYLNTLSKEEALEILNDENVKSRLGSLYDVLVKEFA